jgi:hypothetical protein
MQDVLSKLNSVRQQFDELLQSTAVQPVIPHAVRNELCVMRDDLERIIHQLEKH